MEASQLICRANQLTGFYMMTTLVFNELKIFSEGLFEENTDFEFKRLTPGVH